MASGARRLVHGLLLLGLFLQQAALSAPAQGTREPCPLCRLGTPYFETIAGSDQVGNGIVTAIARDRRGLLWFGTRGGLYSYDGQRLRSYRHDPKNAQSLADDDIRALLPHSDGTLWIGTDAGGVSVYDPRADRFRKHHAGQGGAGSFPSISGLSIVEGRAGEVFIGMPIGLARWSPQTDRFETIPIAASQPDVQRVLPVRSLCFDRNGDLWIGTIDGLRRRSAVDGSVESVHSTPDVPGSLAAQYVYDLFESSDGRIWIGTQSHGLAVLDPRSNTLARIAAGGDGLGQPWISGFSEPASGEIWVHTFGAGIDVVDSQQLRVVRRIRTDPGMRGGLAQNRLTRPLLDADGMLWVGTWGGGLQRYDAFAAASVTTLRHGSTLAHGLSHSSVHAVLPLDGQRIWLGTGGEGIDVLDPGVGIVERLRADPGRVGALSDGTVRALARDPGGDIWVGTQHGGVQRFRMASNRFDAPLAGIPSGTVRQLLVCRDGSLMIGLQAGLIRFDVERGHAHPIRQDATTELTLAVLSMAEDRDGNLWLGTSLELMVLRQAATYPEVVRSDELRLRAATDLTLDADGGLWVGGTRGLYRLREWADGQPRFEDFGATVGLQASGSGHSPLLFDRDGKLWTPRARIDVATRTAEDLALAERAGLGLIEGAGGVDENGLLYVGGSLGLMVIDPRRYRPWSLQPAVLATGLSIDGRASSLERLRDGLVLGPDERHFVLEFAALDYSSPQHLQYRHWLEGYDPLWTRTDAQHRLASYGNLWPGDYVLHVRGSNRHGMLSPHELRVPVRILPTWWQTRWFQVLAAVAIAALAWLLLRWRTMHLRARAAELGAQIEARTRELRDSNANLEQSKADVERAHARLIDTQQQLVEHEKMAALGTLTAGVAHEINNPTNFADGAVQRIDVGLEKLHQFLRQLAGEDAAPEVLQAIAAHFTELGEMTATAHEGHERIKRIVRDLRQFTRLDEAESKSVPIAEPIQSTVNLVRTRFDRVRFELDLEFNPSINCQPAKLSQVFLNLIINACEAIADCADDRDGVVRVSTSAAGDAVRIEVEDNGQGIDPATRLRVFEPFFTTKPVGAGTGLGLAIVFGIIKDHGGGIEVASKPGEGTRFIVQLPLVQHG